jgi:hypothetical protein
VSVSQSALLTKQLLCGYNLSLRGKSVLELGRRRKEGRKEGGGRRKEEGGRTGGMTRRGWKGEIRCRMRVRVRVRVRGGIYMRRSDKREEG